MAGQPTRAQLAALIDHTLLKPEATRADVAALVAEAAELGVYAVCVSPSMVPAALKALEAGAAMPVAAVVGFPSGKHVSEVKAHEAARAVACGAGEVDMVIDVGAALAGEILAVRSDIEAVRAAAPRAVLKVIVESAVLLGRAGGRTLTDVCLAAEDAGADFVKTSTGFHPAGGASVQAVALMAEAVGGRMGVKASGGIRTAADALAMVDAGATRLGLSGSRAVLDGLGGDR
ncbi:deoxyribose-phosphate aldolase [Mycobacterium terramassiliense]|uniref:Deoxyribose-phosphate aldolase n=1 Tax=Mycobacterium terramassiliense TaxID=1841859 RepID=A0A2U3NCC3_9MYCO|nr:deoxyribose-phosphate aldolase [Mycobacterium terramassiliense]SPM29074.1 Deoxyribose-phosphate aldolase [Mycobacterium terramassiliense]